MRSSKNSKENAVTYIEDENKKVEYKFTISVLTFGIVSFITIIILGIVGIIRKDNAGKSIGQIIVGAVLLITMLIALIATIGNLRELKREESEDDRILEGKRAKRRV